MNVWMIKTVKYALVALLLLGLAGIIRGGSKGASFEDLAARTLEEMDSEQLKVGDEQMLRRLYGLNAGELKNWALYISKDNMDVEELLLVEVETLEQLEQVAQAAQKRLEVQENNFEGYGPEQLQLLKKSVIRTEGSYLLFAVAREPEAVKSSFVQAFY